MKFCDTNTTPIELNRPIVNGYCGIFGFSVVTPSHAIARPTMWDFFYQIWWLNVNAIIFLYRGVLDFPLEGKVTIYIP